MRATDKLRLNYSSFVGCANEAEHTVEAEGGDGP